MNLGFLDKSLAKQYPQLYGTNRVRSGLFPPSQSMQNRSVGLLQSPAIEDVSDLSTFLYNRAVVPSVNYLGENINPNVEQAARYFGFDVQNLIPNLQEKDINFSTKQTTTDQPQTITQELTAGIDKAQADKDEKPDVSLQSNGLLSNQQIKDNNVKPNLFNTFESTPAKEGGFTYNLSVTDGQGITDKKQTTEQTTDDVKVDDKEQKVKVTGVDDAPVTDSSVEAVPTSDNKELTPTSSFMKKFENFANTEFGQDFFASLLAESGPKVGTPVSFGANFGKAYEKAKEKQDERKNKGNEQDFAYIVQDTANGRNYNATVDAQGNITVDVDGVKMPYRSDMFGAGTRITTVGNIGSTAMTRGAFYDLAQELQPLEESLRKLVRYNADVGSAPKGIEKMGIEFSAMMKTMLGAGLSPQELVQEVNAGRFQGQIGANRLEIVGGGVMTEQDAIRIINALGGDPSKITTNPEVVNALISDIIAQKYRNYETKLAIYNSQAGTGFYSNMPKKEKITFRDKDLAYITPEVLLEINPDNISIFSKQQILDLDISLLDTPEKEEAYIKRAEELGIKF
jgi:catechol 2,3-dioxygenase-like lactoylglutathione lyase family enzyme